MDFQLRCHDRDGQQGYSIGAMPLASVRFSVTDTRTRSCASETFGRGMFLLPGVIQDPVTCTSQATVSSGTRPVRPASVRPRLSRPVASFASIARKKRTYG
jgi:hypothetical protein